MVSARLLLVDDDRLVLATLSKGLRESGYSVNTAESGAAALALCATATFDLAVVDIRMPKMTGLELAARLRDEYGIATMFLSAYGDREQVVQAVTEGGVGYLVKPAGIVNLIPGIECALARARDLHALILSRTQLEQALTGGRATSMAIGLMMERHHLPEQQAFEKLRAAARDRRQKLEQYCNEIMAAAGRSIPT